MRILAVENIEAAMVDWLRGKGHDVVWAAEELVSLSDDQLLHIAHSASRMLLTRDLDFGALVYREKSITSGIILLRLQAPNQWERLVLLQRWWSEIESHADGHFIVITQDRVRIRPL